MTNQNSAARHSSYDVAGLVYLRRFCLVAATCFLWGGAAQAQRLLEMQMQLDELVDESEMRAAGIYSSPYVQPLPQMQPDYMQQQMYFQQQKILLKLQNDAAIRRAEAAGKRAGALAQQAHRDAYDLSKFIPAPCPFGVHAGMTRAEYDRLLADEALCKARSGKE